MQNILLWSKHPMALGDDGYLGNHISIGFSNNFELDIHETSYTHKMSNDKKYILIANKKHCFYKIAKDNKTLLTSNKSVLHPLAQIIWDDICCSIYNPILIGGNTLAKKKREYKHLLVQDKTKKDIFTIEGLINYILKLIKINKIKIAKNKEYIFKLPYVRIYQLKSLANKIKKTLKEDYNELTIVANSHSKCSILILK